MTSRSWPELPSVFGALASALTCRRTLKQIDEAFLAHVVRCKPAGAHRVEDQLVGHQSEDTATAALPGAGADRPTTHRRPDPATHQRTEPAPPTQSGSPPQSEPDLQITLLREQVTPPPRSRRRKVGWEGGRWSHPALTRAARAWASSRDRGPLTLGPALYRWVASRRSRRAVTDDSRSKPFQPR